MTNNLEQFTHILVVDDDARLRRLLGKYLYDQGWIVTQAEDAKDARAKLGFFVYDAMVLDVMMPGETGIDFAKSLEGSDHPPILMLTAMDEADDRIAGLEAGVDDYLAKPFEPRELVLRLQAIMKRTRTQRSQNSQIVFGAFTYDKDAKSLTKNGEAVYLTSAEMSLLYMLSEHVNEPLSREVLAEAISAEGEQVSERSVDVHMSRLRKKCEENPTRPVTIQTVRGQGYRFSV